MKKRLSILSALLALTLVLGLGACAQHNGGNDTSAPSETAQQPLGISSVQEVGGIDIPDFRISINDIEVTHETVAGLTAYSITTTTINRMGNTNEVNYIGFAFRDVLEAAGFTEEYVWLEATATDGYFIRLTGDVIYESTTLLTIRINDSPFVEAPWLTPNSIEDAPYHIRNVAYILLHTTEGAP